MALDDTRALHSQSAMASGTFSLEGFTKKYYFYL